MNLHHRIGVQLNLRICNMEYYNGIKNVVKNIVTIFNNFLQFSRRR